MTAAGAAGRIIKFGPFEVTNQVFLTTPHSFALVNLKPLIQGHVLVCPHNPHKRLTDLTSTEISDLFTTTVPHVHVHVVPRTAGDMGSPDAVYVKLAGEEGNVGGALWDKEMGTRPKPGGGLRRVDDVDRKARSVEAMAEEAERYKAILKEMGIE
ncbi:Dinucleoside triphosphate hydrolase [Fusarium oxysporum]|nr:Dinucleoside triphosphate hydrolase [Fusarium oxysporum]